MLIHEAKECLQKTKEEPNNEGDEDNDDNDDYPPGCNGDDTTNGGPEPFANGEFAEQRKTEASSSNSEDQSPSKLICYEMRQDYTTDNTHVCFSKRRHTQSEMMEIRNGTTSKQHNNKQQ